MKNEGRMPFGGKDRNHRYFPEDDFEAAEELSPDPFSQEEHSKIHNRRFSERKRAGNTRTFKKTQNHEIYEDKRE